MRVTVNVTEANIRAGHSEDDSCPIALALLDQVPDCQDVSVTVGTISFRDLWDSYRVQTPGAVIDFISEFDAGRPVAPTSFLLEFEPADPTA